MRYRYTDPETGEVTDRKVFFPRPKALIPLIDEDGEHLRQWGRRSEQEDSNTDAPVTGWARLESLEKDFWLQHEPVKVLIPALEFCEKPEGFPRSVWYPPLQPNTYLMGLKLVKEGKRFVYVVTQQPKLIFRDIDRLPVIVNANFEMQNSIECEFEEPPKKSPRKDNGGQLGLFSFRLD